jgi:hypothetical protein
LVSFLTFSYELGTRLKQIHDGMAVMIITVFQNPSECCRSYAEVARRCVGRMDGGKMQVSSGASPPAGAWLRPIQQSAGRLIRMALYG